MKTLSKSARSSIAPTQAQAARFLMQSAMGAQMTDIDSVCELGYESWLTTQMAMPIIQTYVSFIEQDTKFDQDLVATPKQPFVELEFNIEIWKRFLSNPDQLRQRMAFALSQIFVINVDDLPGQWLPSNLAGNHMDILEKRAFGNFRDLLQDVSLSTAMGFYLTHKSSAKANFTPGSMPDENYAREIMQLFTIGLVMLNDDGSPILDSNNAPIDTYGISDVQQLARVFTGWEHTSITSIQSRIDSAKKPMANWTLRYETGAKTFLGLNIPEGTNAYVSLKMALDHLFNHQNVPPFIGRQLIQRFVTSNPSPAYIGRVSAVFRNNGAGIRGDLAATLRAVLLDPEARNVPTGVGSQGQGKLREPILRFTAWARACKVGCPTGNWNINTADPAFGLAQAPGRAPSVFNFYRPGYIPPGTQMAGQKLVAPEFQITTESSVAGYLNFMLQAISSTNEFPFGGLVFDYSEWDALAGDPVALVKRANLLLSGGGLSPVAIKTIAQAVLGMPSSTFFERRNRVRATMLLTMAAPGTLVSR